MVSALGDFLQAARGRVSPAQVGLPTGERRRVAGLRREEVAMLAGVSVDYYQRLEQGRETSPSGQVAQSVGRALRLDEYATAHLYRLAGLTPHRSSAIADMLDPDVAALLDEWVDHPALILGTAFDVIAANPLGEALFTGFPGTRNLLESLFLVPENRELYEDWDGVARNTVAGFRLLWAAQPDHPRIREVLEGLRRESPAFEVMWADHLARGHRLVTKVFGHPLVGRLELRVQTFDVRSSPGQELVVYRAAAGSTSAQRLASLRGFTVA